MCAKYRCPNCSHTTINVMYAISEELAAYVRRGKANFEKGPRDVTITILFSRVEVKTIPRFLEHCCEDRDIGLAEFVSFTNVEPAR